MLALVASVVIGLVLVAPHASAQGRNVRDASERRAIDAPPPSRDGGGELGPARERWNRLTPRERDALLERYRSFRELDTDTQKELVDRARRVRDSAQRITNELGPDMREKLRELDPERRRELTRELVIGEARGKGLELRSRMPDQWAEELENATPAERPAILDRFRRQHLNRLANIALDRLGKRLQLPPEELAVRRKLPFEERAAVVLEMRKAVQELDATENGLLPGISADDWQELQRLPPEQFYERIQAYRTQRIAEQAAREARGEPNEEDDARPRPADAPGPPGPDGGPPGPGGPPPRLSPFALEGLRQLRDVLRPDPRDVVTLIDLEPEERAGRMFELRRDRCLAALRAFELAPERRIDELRDMPEPAFVANMRRMLAPLHAMEHGLPWPPPDRRGPPPDHLGPPPDGLGPPRLGPPPRHGPPGTGPERPPPREGQRSELRTVPGLHDGGRA